MGEAFDPYYKWLGIPPKDQPPHHYRLLGIEVFEQDRDVIDAAANRLMGYLKELAVGDEAAHSQKLLNEIARARICLLNEQQKGTYDQQLRDQLAFRKPPPRAGMGAATPPPAASAEAPPPKQIEPPPPVLDSAPPHPRRSKRSTPPSPGIASSPPLKTPATGDESAANSESATPAVPFGGTSGIQIVVDPEGGRQKRASQDASSKSASSRRTFGLSLGTWLMVGLVLVLSGLLFAVLRGPLPGEPADGGDSDSEPQAGGPLALGPPVLIVKLRPRESLEITEFRIDDVPQDLPPEPWYKLAPGEHDLLLRRKGYQPVEHKIRDSVMGQQIVFRPKWEPE